MFCKNCGKEVKEGSTRCVNCGSYLNDENKITTPASDEQRKNTLNSMSKLGATENIRSPWIAFLLSFFIMGWGQLYDGRTKDGLKFFGLFVFLTILASLFSSLLNLLGLICLVVWIYNLYDVYNTTNKINRGELEFTGKSRWFWLPAILALLMLIIVVFTIIVGIAGIITKPPLPPHIVSPPSGYVKFTEPEYSIYLPSGWSVSDRGRLTKGIDYVTYEANSDSAAPTVGILSDFKYKYNWKGSFNDDFTNNFVAGFQEQLRLPTYVHIVKDAPTSGYAGYSAREIELDIEDNDPTKIFHPNSEVQHSKFRMKVIMIDGGDKLYILEYSALDKNYSSQEADTILKSFNIN